MKVWSKPFRLLLKVIRDGKTFEDDAYHDTQAYASRHARDLVAQNSEADLVEVSIYRQRRFRGDFAISAELLSLFTGGRLNSQAARHPLPPERMSA